jgi:hypothetical protein
MEININLESVPFLESWNLVHSDGRAIYQEFQQNFGRKWSKLIILIFILSQEEHHNQDWICQM